MNDKKVLEFTSQQGDNEATDFKFTLKEDGKLWIQLWDHDIEGNYINVILAEVPAENMDALKEFFNE